MQQGIVYLFLLVPVIINTTIVSLITVLIIILILINNIATVLEILNNWLLLA